MNPVTLNVLAWSEFTEPKGVYPKGIHGELADYLNRVPGVRAVTSQISDPDSGLNEEILSRADVLIWWGHQKHAQVPEEAVERVVGRVRNEGMGFIALHSSHFSKPFIKLMGTKCSLGSWREDGKSERVHIVDRFHPISQGVSDFILPKEEMYGEPFDIPRPKDLVLVSVFETDGAVFRSGLTWTAGKGKIFYFRAGHETFPTFRDPNVQLIIKNAVHWVASD